MKRLVALFLCFLAGCSGAHSDLPQSHRTLVPVVASTTRPGRDPANTLTQAVFQYEPLPNASPDKEGWIERPVKFEVQHPFDLPLQERWSYEAGTDTQTLWVLNTDKAHLPPPNRTTPRTELRLIDPEYLPNTGLHAMECDLYVEPGTFACITQVFSTGPMAMIVVDPEGTISDLRTHDVIARNMNGRWFHWRVVHDSGATGAGAIQVYVDGQLTHPNIAARKSASYYFKVGVYSRHDSTRSAVRVRDLRVWWKPGNK